MGARNRIEICYYMGGEEISPLNLFAVREFITLEIESFCGSNGV